MPYNYSDPSLGVNIGSSLVSAGCEILAEAGNMAPHHVAPVSPNKARVSPDRDARAQPMRGQA